MNGCLWLRASSLRTVVQAHLRHVAGVFRAAGWRIHEGASLPSTEELGGPLAVLDDPWIEAVPAAARALAEATASDARTRPVWRVPRLRGATAAQAWEPRGGPYTLAEVRRRAVDRRDLRIVPTEELDRGLVYGLAVATADEVADLLDLGWPPAADRLALVPGVRLYRYDDPADHERREIDAFVPKDARVVVDVGCGHGRLGERLRAPSRQVIGIEPDPTMAREAGPRLDRVLARRAEEALPSLDVPVDCFVFADVLEHLPDPARVLALAAERLAPDGRIVVSIPNTAWAPVLRDLAAGRWEPTLAGVQARDHLGPTTLDSLRRMAEECGLEVGSVTAQRPPLPWRLRLWARLVARLSGGRADTLTAAQWIVVLKAQAKASSAA